MKRFYFDHNATTPVSADVSSALLEAIRDYSGNPSSIHQDGQQARHALERARLDICKALGCGPKELVLVSGGTEADNLAIFGAVRASDRAVRHVITTAIEHPAVLNACAQLEAEGVAVSYVAPDSRGVVTAERIAAELRPETVLISVMHANNETGVLQLLTEIAEVARRAGVLFHSDGVQAFGKTAVDVRSLGVDLYSISGHKVYAPKGVGALYVRQGVNLRAIQFGGKHERSRRAGTENVPGALALAAAARWVTAESSAERLLVGELRDRLESSIRARVPDVVVNGAGADRVSNTTNISFDGIDGEAMVIALDLRGFAVSTGSACSSGAVEPSHVLTAMQIPKDRAKSAIRFSLGLGNTAEQVDALVEAVVESAAHLRKLSPTYA